MMKLALFCLLIITTPAIIQGFMQEIYFYDTVDASGTSIYINRHVPNASLYDGLENVQRLCVRGLWAFYKNVNYLDYAGLIGSDSGNGYFCKDTGPFTHKSFRYFGFSDTSRDSISLYTRTSYEGAQYLIEGAFGGPLRIINSMVLTGPSNWTLYERNDFDGPLSICQQGSTTSNRYVLQTPFNDTIIATVGSLIKGC